MSNTPLNGCRIRIIFALLVQKTKTYGRNNKHNVRIRLYTRKLITSSATCVGILYNNIISSANIFCKGQIIL